MLDIGTLALLGLAPIPPIRIPTGAQARRVVVADDEPDGGPSIGEQDCSPGTEGQVCSLCGVRKPLSEFTWHREGDRGRHHSHCKACRTESYKAKYHALGALVTRQCGYCRVTKPKSEMVVGRRICKECVAAGKSLMAPRPKHFCVGCGKTKTGKEFPSAGGRYCRDCNNAKRRETRSKKAKEAAG